MTKHYTMVWCLTSRILLCFNPLFLKRREVENLVKFMITIRWVRICGFPLTLILRYSNTHSLFFTRSGYTGTMNARYTVGSLPLVTFITWNMSLWLNYFVLSESSLSPKWDFKFRKFLVSYTTRKGQIISPYCEQTYDPSGPKTPSRYLLKKERVYSILYRIDR